MPASQIARLTSIALLLATTLAGTPRPGGPQQDDAPDRSADIGRALYDGMVRAMRQADSLHWVSDYRWNSAGLELGHAVYEIWLEKPNFARLEARPFSKTEPSGILIGDGRSFWIHWPHGKIRYPFEQKGRYAADYDEYKDRFYMRAPSPPHAHSIAHQTGYLDAGMSMTIIDPSTFHGYTDSLQPYIDRVRPLGHPVIDDITCDLIEVSYMAGQRLWYLWLDPETHLPRKLRQVIHAAQDIITEEVWSQVTLNEPVPEETFAWTPPEGWKEWRIPAIEEGLLKPGSEAPDFELAALGGGTIKLSSFRGQIVWLNKWRCG